MTKHNIRPGGDSPEEQSLALVLGSMAEMLDRARLEIVAMLKKINESVDIIARQIKRQIPPEE